METLHQKDVSRCVWVAQVVEEGKQIKELGKLPVAQIPCRSSVRFPVSISFFD